MDRIRPGAIDKFRNSFGGNSTEIARLNDLETYDSAIRILTFATLESRLTLALSQMDKDKDLSPTEAKVIAIGEAAALMCKYPRMTWLYTKWLRYYCAFRSLELMGKLKRGEDTLFVGSGYTIEEVLAYYISPPESIDCLVAHPRVFDDASVAFAKELNADQSTYKNIEKIEYLSGRATAIEPASFPLEYIEDNRHCLDGLDFRMRPLTVQQLLSTSDLDQLFNSVVINRADPSVYPITDTTSPDNRGILEKLGDKVMVGGTIVVTVGIGNTARSFRELDTRLSFIKTAGNGQLSRSNWDIFKQVFVDGVSRTTGAPIYPDNVDAMAFSSDPAITGYFTARRTPERTTASKEIKTPRGKVRR